MSAAATAYTIRIGVFALLPNTSDHNSRERVYCILLDNKKKYINEFYFSSYKKNLFEKY